MKGVIDAVRGVCLAVSVGEVFAEAGESDGYVKVKENLV